ncbi:hypothetical protein ACFLXF_00685 [Chloroflexota bacterium]
MREYQAIYPELKEFINSTAVSRVNGYVGGNGSMEHLQKEIDRLGLSAAGKDLLLEIFGPLEKMGLGWCPTFTK